MEYVHPTVRTCTACSETKPIDCFTHYKYKVNGRYKAKCKDCIAKEARGKRKSNPPLVRAYRLNYFYNITTAQYQALWDLQKGLCAICKQPERAVDKRYGTPIYLGVDHDHKCCPSKRSCGKCIRGLLCRLCNKLLGQFGDNLVHILKVVGYLQRYESK